MKSKTVRFRVIKDIYWDDWGRFVKVFSRGQECSGELYESGAVIAESPYYEGISDSVNLDCIEII